MFKQAKSKRAKVTLIPIFLYPPFIKRVVNTKSTNKIAGMPNDAMSQKMVDVCELSSASFAIKSLYIESVKFGPRPIIGDFLYSSKSYKMLLSLVLNDVPEKENFANTSDKTGILSKNPERDKTMTIVRNKMEIISDRLPTL